MRTEDQEYLSGFAFEAMVQKGSDQWTVVKAGVNYFRALLTEHEMEFNQYNRGRIDALLSAIGVDGVCSPDCVCRTLTEHFSRKRLRLVFHRPYGWKWEEIWTFSDEGLVIIKPLAWLPPNDKQANGRFNRRCNFPSCRAPEEYPGHTHITGNGNELTEIK